MRLDSTAVEALRRLIDSKGIRNLASKKFVTGTLSGALEFLTTERVVRLSDPVTADLLMGLVEKVPIVAEAAGAWASRDQARLDGDIHGVRIREFWRIRQIGDMTCDGFQLFQERFVRSAKATGLQGKFAMALASTFGEMCDNVVQHSGAILGEYSGLAGYAVHQGAVGFAVCDSGEGVYASLRGSPSWSHLASSREALDAAVLHGASRRQGHPEGHGFKTLFQNLVDRNSRCRFRSGDACLHIGDGTAGREAQVLSSPPLCGLQMAVYCHAGQNAKEFDT
jgi:hypothetical protein